MKEIYNIEGMTCAACSSAVERVTRKLDGVSSSNVNLTTNKMVIEYDEKKVNPELIISKVEKAGFEISKDEIKKDKPKKEINNKYDLLFLISFSIILMYISMGHMIKLPQIDFIMKTSHPFNYVLIQLLITVTIIFIGRRYIINGLKLLFKGNPNMDSLVAISVSASFLYSLIVSFLIQDYPSAINTLYFDAAAMIITFVSIGKHLEENSKRKTKGAIEKLFKLKPKTALLIKDIDKNIFKEVLIEKVNISDILLIKPGSTIALDGVVIKGTSSVNESMLTGESLPIDKKIGDEVIGGSINTDGILYIKVTRIGEDTTLSKIIKFVEDAQEKKAPISKIADKVASIFVPIVMIIAFFSALVWLIVGKDISFVLNVFTSVLVIACPCALGLATPTAIMVGTGVGANNGILIRNGEALETINNANVVILDKTGTITEGNLKVVDIFSNKLNTKKVLEIAGIIEKVSQHPLSNAIVKRFNEENLNSTLEIKDFENITGKGIKATLNNQDEVIIGNKKLMNDFKIITDNYEKQISFYANKGQTPVIMAINNQVEAIISISDTIKENSKYAISKLKEKGIKVVMVTGDNKQTALNIAKEVNIDYVESEILPTEKAYIVEKYQKENKVIMVGDGINDAPALVQADVGFAIGNGSDIAIESADVILMKNDILDIPKALRLSQLTIRNIKQNLFWAFFYNTLGIPIAAGLIYAFGGFLLNPMFGSFAMSLSSIFVVTNALRLRYKKIN